MTVEAPLPILTGQLIVGGFSGTTLPSTFAKALAAGERGGAILFKRNLTSDAFEVSALCAAIRAEAARGIPTPAFLAVDQEGGRVGRFGAPLLRAPAMLTLGGSGDLDLIHRAALQMARELSALGFSTAFSPVLDVATNPKNPIIGDRAFSRDAGQAARLAMAFARGLSLGGLLACGKHFPGHGDTSKDSHLDLPVVLHSRERLMNVELVPFIAAARAGIDLLMTAHVLYPALDPERPATLSHAICTDLRQRIGFRGALVSDDLEMRALSDRDAIEDTAVQAIEAGCDMLLICSSEELQSRAHGALVRRAERDASFKERCAEAFGRVLACRTRHASRQVSRDDFLSLVTSDEARDLQVRLLRLSETA